MLLLCVFCSNSISDNSTEKLSGLIADKERNLFVYYPTKQVSRFNEDIQAAISSCEPSSSLSKLLKSSE